METELKFGFKEKDSLFALAKTDAFLKCCKDPDRKPVLLENSYFDTRDLIITKRTGAVRVRHYSGEDTDSYEITVKYKGGTSKGLHQRYEWNADSIDGKFSIESFMSRMKDGEDPDGLLSEVFAGIKDEDLSVVCFNSFYRTYYELHFGNSVIEACFDSGMIRNSDGTKTDEICELELELISGSVEDLKELSGILTENADCSPLDKTKYGRTLNMAMGDRNEE